MACDRKAFKSSNKSKKTKKVGFKTLELETTKEQQSLELFFQGEQLSADKCNLCTGLK